MTRGHKLRNRSRPARSGTHHRDLVHAFPRSGRSVLADFIVGVQWHPENFWRTGEFRPLFEGFLEAASA